MALRHTIDFILNHPLNKHQKGKAIWRFLIWQLKARLTSGYSIAKYGEKSKLFVKKGMAGATGNIYSGLHEFEEMSFLLHFLKSTDCFIDIGANVGSYTILGSNERGAETISIEPIPQTFKLLNQNVELNNVNTLVRCLNIGLANKKSVIKFTTSLDSQNHVAKDYDTDTVDVKVDRFDDIIQLNRPTLIKMDVEGYESEVLEGMKEALASVWFKAMIIELNSTGRRYGFDERVIHENLKSFNFIPYSYNPHTRTLDKLEINGPYNTIYIKDYPFVSERLQSAKTFSIHGKVI